MRNCWIDRRRNRQLDEVSEFLTRNFTDLQMIKRPHPRGQKLFIKQLGLHLGNVLYEGHIWKIQYYHRDGSYIDHWLPEHNSTDFWEAIKTAFHESAIRSAIKKSA